MSSMLSLLFYIMILGASTALLWYGRKKSRSLFVVLGIGLISFVAALRFEVGTDYTAYATSYQLINGLSLTDFINGYGEFYEIGIYLFAKVASGLPFSIQIFFGLFSFFTLLFFYFAAKKYAKDNIQLWLLTALYLFTVFPASLNTARQMLAVAVFFYASTFIFSQRFWKYAIFTILAALFHKSAILLLPIYFLGKLLKKDKILTLRQIVVIGMAIGVVALLGSAIVSIVLATPFFDKYDKYQDISAASGGLVLILKLIILAIITILYRYIKSYPYFAFCIVMSLVEVIILIVARSSVDLSRFSIYFSMFPLILLSCIPKAFDYRGKLIAIVLVSFYALAFFYLSFYILNGSEIFPYKYQVTGVAL